MNATHLLMGQCPKCGARLQVKSRSMSKSVGCPKCHSPATVSSAEVGGGVAPARLHAAKIAAAIPEIAPSEKPPNRPSAPQRSPTAVDKVPVLPFMPASLKSMDRKVVPLRAIGRTAKTAPEPTVHGEPTNATDRLGRVGLFLILLSFTSFWFGDINSLGSIFVGVLVGAVGSLGFALCLIAMFSNPANTASKVGVSAFIFKVVLVLVATAVP